MNGIGFDLDGFISELKSRNLMKDIILPKSDTFAKEGLFYSYCGFDATSNSLHIGHLIPITIIKLAKRFGVKSICIIGNGTTEIGDPTDKNETRKMMTAEQIGENSAKIAVQLRRILGPDFILHNKTWLGGITALEFIRIALDFSLNTIVKMHTFENRLSKELHLSLGEILYPVLQAYDWAFFNGLEVKANSAVDEEFSRLIEEYKQIKNSGQTYHCIQVSGSDQYGNMTQGQTYIKKIMGKEVCGVTANLLTLKSGEKMGKSLAGALYLSEEMVGPYDFFQGIVNFSDDSAKDAAFALLIDENTEKIKADFNNDPRKAKIELAYKLTRLVHGELEAKSAREKSISIFEQKLDFLIDSITWPGVDSLKLKHLVHSCDLADSVSAAERAIEGREIYVNQVIVTDKNMLLPKREYIISRGKKRHVKVSP